MIYYLKVYVKKEFNILELYKKIDIITCIIVLTKSALKWLFLFSIT